MGWCRQLHRPAEAGFGLHIAPDKQKSAGQVQLVWEVGDSMGGQEGGISRCGKRLREEGGDRIQHLGLLGMLGLTLRQSPAASYTDWIQHKSTGQPVPAQYRIVLSIFYSLQMSGT